MRRKRSLTIVSNFSTTASYEQAMYLVVFVGVSKKDEMIKCLKDADDEIE